MKLNKIIVAGLSVVLLAGCGGNVETKPAEEPAAPTTVAAESNAKDVTADVEAYLAKELESDSTAAACKDRDVKWVCNLQSVTRNGDSLTVTVTKLEVPSIKAAAMGFKNFLANPDSPVTDAKQLTVTSGSESETVDMG